VITSPFSIPCPISKEFFGQADIDLNRRAGELSEEEVDKIVTIMQNPRQYKIPDWFLNRQKDIKDGELNNWPLIAAKLLVMWNVLHFILSIFNANIIQLI
jgi:hypothetical protein